MPFRKIRPSSGDSSISAPAVESTGSSLARSSPRTEIETGSSSSASKRRRVPESVTRNACLNCKKARAKCDGRTPCTRCVTRAETSLCVYEVHIKHAKEELVREIKELRAKDHLKEQILGALSAGEQGEQVAEILQRLRQGESYESIVEWLGCAPNCDAPSPRESQHSTFESSDLEMGGMPSPFRWTNITSDNNIIHHLFQLYFAWVHPVHTLFSEGYFFKSYQNQSGEYCSSALVNAICAMACHLHTGADTDEINFEQLGARFSNSVSSTVEPQDRSITTIQAFAVMFLASVARGKSLRASSYLRMASSGVSSVEFQGSEGFEVVLRNTNRGIRCLDAEWAQVTFQVPISVHNSPVEAIDDDNDMMDDTRWYFYRYMSESCPSWPSLIATTNREKAKLTEIINSSATLLYSNTTQPIKARQIMQLYTKYVNWRDELPSALALRNIEESNSQALPHVLSLLILYSGSVMQLLRPLLDFKGFPSRTIEEVVWAYAQEGLFLLDKQYRARYTCRYQPVLQMFVVLHFCDLIARFPPGKINGSAKDGPKAIQLGMEALMQSRLGFPIAESLQGVLRQIAEDHSIPFPAHLNTAPLPCLGPPAYSLNNIIDACTIPSYTQPVCDIQEKFEQTFAADWVAENPVIRSQQLVVAGGSSRALSSEEVRGAQNLMNISNLLNTN